jgi:hypothetical protein
MLSRGTRANNLGLNLKQIVLTLAIFAPFTVAFVLNINFYPIPVWSLFSEAVSPEEGRIYYVLTAERADGTIHPLPAIEVSRALHGRNHTFVGYVLDNSSFMIESPHPDNVRYIATVGRVGRVEPGARVSELLKAWGHGYNARFTAESPRRLTHLRLDGFRWIAGSDPRVRTAIGSWRVQL